VSTAVPVSAEALLAGLDDEQRVAAQTLLGPVCLLAGAGTGKTRAITHRIAYGVATGAYAPGRVMALTFTARAAAELRGRLRQLGAAGIAARTFHASALSQLGYFWPQVIGGSTRLPILAAYCSIVSWETFRHSISAAMSRSAAVSSLSLSVSAAWPSILPLLSRMRGMVPPMTCGQK
jgi:superfamily I DNA/RNA helicase